MIETWVCDVIWDVRFLLCRTYIYDGRHLLVIATR